MDVLTLARILLRRWYVIVPVLGLTVVGVILVGLRDTPTYAARGSMIVASPELQTADQSESGTVSAADVAAPSVLAEVMADAEVAERIVDAGGSEDYAVAASSEEGLLRVTGTGGSERAAIATVDSVLDVLVAESERRQDEVDIPEDQRISVEVLSRPASTVETEAEDGGVQHEAVGSARVSGRYGTENPYGSTSFSFAVLEELFSSDQGRAELAKSDATAGFELELDESIIRLAVTGETPDEVTRTYETLVEKLGAELEARQVALGIPSPERTRMQTLAEPLGVTSDQSDLVRPLVTLAGMGIVTAVALTLLFDNLMTALAARRAVAEPPIPSARKLAPAPPTQSADGNGSALVPRPLRDLTRAGRDGPSARPAAPTASSSRRGD